MCVVICAGSFSGHAGNMLSLCVYSEISMVPTNNVALATLKWICWLSKILLWGNFFIVFSWKTFWDFFWSRLATTFARSDSRAGHIFISSLFFFDKNVNEALAWIKREKIHFLMVSASNLELHMEMRKITLEMFSLNSGKLTNKDKSKVQS